MSIKQQGGIFGRNPTFNDLTVDGTLTVNGEPISDFGSMAQQDANAVNITGGTATLDGLTVDTNTLHVDASNNATLVGTTTWNTVYDPKLQVEGSAGDGTEGILVSSYKPSVTFFDFSGGAPAVHRIAADSGKLSFEIDTAQNGTFTEAFGVTAAGNIAMASGNGIDFSATSGTGTSELFDDYEEGTWSPTYEPATGAFGAIGYDGYRLGKYIKAGKLVHVEGRLRTTGITIGTASGQIYLGGLPFAIDGSFNVSIAQAYSFTANNPDNATNISNNVGLHSGLNAVQASDLDTGVSKNYARFSFTYYTSA